MNTTQEQLTLLVNGRLDPESQRALQAALAEDPELENERRFQSALRENLKKTEVVGPGDLNLQRVHRRVQQERRVQMLSRWRVGAIAAMFLLVFGGSFVLQKWNGQTDSLNVQLLSGSESADLQVSFTNAMTLGELQSLLDQIDAEIVYGPGSLGIYGLKLKDDDALEQTLTLLSEDKRVEQVVVLQQDDGQ